MKEKNEPTAEKAEKGDGSFFRTIFGFFYLLLIQALISRVKGGVLQENSI